MSQQVLERKQKMVKMSVWMKNFRMAMSRKQVLILHGNVRDKYIDVERNRIFENLTEFLNDAIREFHFDTVVFYDPVGQERYTKIKETTKKLTTNPELEGDDKQHEKKEERMEVPPTRLLAKWQDILSEKKMNTFAVLFYLDKIIQYKSSYSPEEMEILLRLEKQIENITPNNRIVLVSLLDTFIPVELYTNSPKTYILSIPLPNKVDRESYLKFKLGSNYQHNELISNLTDGLFLRDLDIIVNEITSSKEKLNSSDVKKIINKYRIGAKEDYWGSIDIEKIKGAFTWFTEDQGVKGQDEAVRRVIDVLLMARSGLSGIASGVTSKPKGVLFFAGPTGVGKTFLAKKLAKFLFASEDAFIRFDMSEYKEEHTVSKMIGSPPGYVGHEKGGILTNAIKEKPFSVILFDEIEKAHPKIMDIFLQILDEGRLTDSRGQTVFFTESVIIFTSNIGTRTINSQNRPIDEKKTLDEILMTEMPPEKKRQEIKKHFIRCNEQFFISEISRPELLNRIGNNIIPFNYIDSADVQTEIIKSHLKRIKAEFEDRYKSIGHKIEFDVSLVNYLIEKYSKQISHFGGRGITNAIENEIITLLAIETLRVESKQAKNRVFKVGVENCEVKVEVD